MHCHVKEFVNKLIPLFLFIVNYTLDFIFLLWQIYNVYWYTENVTKYANQCNLKQYDIPEKKDILQTLGKKAPSSFLIYLIFLKMRNSCQKEPSEIHIEHSAALLVFISLAYR